jgi:signal transduction histidine kinase
MHDTDSGIRVLMVDDERMSFDMLTGMFAADPDVALCYAGDPAAVVATAKTFRPSVILVDLRMPGADGLDIIRMLRADPATAAVPILMLSSEVDPHIKAAGFAAGAADYLVKWPDRVELAARVRANAGAYRTACELLRRTEQLAVAQAALHEAQKNEAIGKLTATIAHDVNNILHLINGHLQLMRMERGDERSLRRIDAATEGVKRGTHLTTQLLAMARNRPQARTRVDLAAFLRGIEATAFNAGDAPPCMLALADGTHQASLDPVELQKVLVELVTNAREATRDGSPVTVTLDSEQVASRTARVAAGDYVRICVSDRGAGMDAEVQRRAFEPFFSTKAGVQGAGLGLALAAGFVRRHDGQIELDSEVGRGTRVVMRFPRSGA